MFKRIDTMVYMEEFGAAILQHLIDPVGYPNSPFDGLVARYYVNDVVPTKESELGDFTASELGGDIALDALDGPINLVSGNKAFHQQLHTVAGLAPANETIYGVAIVDPGSPDVLVAAARFREADGPNPIAFVDDFVSVDLVFPFQLYAAAA